MFEFARDALELGRSTLPVPPRERKIIEKGYEACAQTQTCVEVQDGTEDSATAAQEELERYPSTPHLRFSPQVHADDEVNRFDDDIFCGKEIVVTEKLDGGNCCLFGGKVFARTHKHEVSPLFRRRARSVGADLHITSLRWAQTTHESFGPVKAQYQEARSAQQLVSFHAADDD